MISRSKLFYTKLTKSSILSKDSLSRCALLLNQLNQYKFSSGSGLATLEYDSKIPSSLKASDFLLSRHLGPNDKEIQEMLSDLGLKSLDELMKLTVPQKVLDPEPYNIPGGEIPEPMTEELLLKKIQEIAEKNKLNKCYIGGGYYGTITPQVIARNLLENPNWYTAYTPYQGEISQGRLEAILNFQTLIAELTGMEIANASLLDEGTACAETMAMCHGLTDGNRNTFFVANNVFPNSIEVVKTRAENVGIHVVVGDPSTFDFTKIKGDLFGVLLQSPDVYGVLHNYKGLIEKIQGLTENHCKFALACDPLALLKTVSAGEAGFDVAVGNSQRYGVPMGYGGPHAAFLATKNEYLRKMPGRIIGISKDRFGNKVFRMTLQTREQHIRREKASSNICTAQVLLANVAAMYAVYHGKEGLLKIATRVNSLTQILAHHLKGLGYTLVTKDKNSFFDTVSIVLKEEDNKKLLDHMYKHEINLGQVDSTTVRVSLDETTTLDDVRFLLIQFASFHGKKVDSHSIFDHSDKIVKPFEESLKRQKDLLNQEIFNKIHSEHQMLRYLHYLATKDITLTKSMISLGSCTMKLNATVEMRTIAIPQISLLHPFVPDNQALGYHELNEKLKSMLRAITKFDDISLQPNSGAQGEYAGLSTIHAYLKANGQGHRNICLIPSSAHGTNPATAAICGMKVVVVKSDQNGNIDLKDLKDKAEQHKDNLAAFMVTYPSTHGVYEDTITAAINIIHQYGGQVYMDGANMNAQSGWTSPGYLHADVCHLNLHKTFCIPHGGGGPGMGPIGVKKHLAPFLPGRKGGAVSSARYGSASILSISLAYIWALGKEGIKKATAVSILNANYIAEKLRPHYPILYQGNHEKVAHEFIVDFRPIKAKTGISEEDVAKRLGDFGFHAPTMSFPVPGSMLIEPTESEDKGELDRFIEALIKIREEIKKVEDGVWDKLDNPLKNAPHPAHEVMATKWKHCYTREEAAFPLPWVEGRGKYWPTVGRIDNVHGDRNPVCLCPPTSEFL